MQTHRHDNMCAYASIYKGDIPFSWTHFLYLVATELFYNPYCNFNTCINSRIKWESKRFYGKRKHVQQLSCWGNCSLSLCFSVFSSHKESDWHNCSIFYSFILLNTYKIKKKNLLLLYSLLSSFFFLSSPFLAMCQMLTMVAAVWK